MNKDSLRDMIEKGELKAESLTPGQKKQLGELRNIADRYKDKSVDEISTEVDKLTQRGDVKKFIESGKLNSVADALRPMLSPEQGKKLDELLNRYGKRRK